VDQSTWADVREKLDQQNAEPAAQTVADTRFEEGVKSFEAGNYDAAARKFENAMRLSPNDMILPFAYAQALFADGQYTESADLLRQALSKASPEQEGVFYPRGLYANDDVLFAQIENLVDKLERSATTPTCSFCSATICWASVKRAMPASPWSAPTRTWRMPSRPGSCWGCSRRSRARPKRPMV
jgi:tetratricopeptide (TPR) repeat protein